MGIKYEQKRIFAGREYPQGWGRGRGGAEVEPAPEPDGGKEPADERVTRSLYQRAIGYSYDAVKVFLDPDTKKPIYAPYREHVHPDTTACIFWLKNRRPKRYDRVPRNRLFSALGR